MQNSIEKITETSETLMLDSFDFLIIAIYIYIS